MHKVFPIILITVSLGLHSCSTSVEKPLKISATTWIGYAPLYYAKAKGWLDAYNIKLLNVVSLSENMYLYKSGKVDAYAGTQYEYSVLKNKIPSLTPIMLFDRSNGGDIILSNASIKELQESDKKIDVYLEIDSINSMLLEDFLRRFEITEKRINYINKDQTEIAHLKKHALEGQTLIVTYSPYDIKLKARGYKTILSTKNDLSLLVIDALFTMQETYAEHKEQFVQLKHYVDQAILDLEEDPKSFYQTIKVYLDGMSYKQFLAALDDIEWVNRKLSQKLKKRMSNALFPTKDLL